MATKKTKGKWIVKLLKAAVTAYLLLILCQMIGNAYSRLSITHKIPVSEEWNLIVVNRWNELPEDYSVELTELSNGQKVDSRIYPYLQEMFDAARAEDVYPVVREGYRKKTFLKSFLSDVFIYEEEQKDGRILKGLRFKFPIYMNGRNVLGVDWDNESTDETVRLLSRKSPV